MSYYTRKPTRIPNYDYSKNNYYFITICTYEKKCIFGTIEALNTMGNIAKSDLESLSNYYEGVYIDKFIVMPNHIHAIIVLENQKKSLSEIIGSYKSGVSRKIRELNDTIQVWQRSFHDHIIRNERSYTKIWNYVEYNNQKWLEDCFYVGAEDD